MPSSANWRSVAYGDGKFVALGYNSTKAATSPDGITWTARTMPTSSAWRAVAYGGGQFVAIAYLSFVASTSPDGITWTNRSLPVSGYWQSLVYGNGTFLSLSATNAAVAITSPDGITWTQRTMPVSGIWQAAAYGNGVFVAVCANSSIAATSPDGITWTQQALPVSTAWNSITYGNGKFVAISTSGGIAATSTDGITWTQQALPTTSYWFCVTSAAGLFIALAQNTSIAASSPDGVTWTQLSLDSSSNWYAVAYGSGNFAAIASGTATANYYAYAEAAAAIGAQVSAPNILGQAAVQALAVLHARASAPSVLSAAAAQVYHDFTGQLGDAVTLYVMDLITPTGAVRVPISSWQATLQTGSSNYVQCVIPACLVWASAINTATEFVIYRKAVLTGGLALEYEMARAPATQVQFDRGPQRYTCTLSGYSTAFAEDLDPPAVFDRDLTGIRSISSGSGMRVRCAIDWLLRPGHRAYADGVPFVVGYINYYAPSGFDAYMDVGSRS